MIEQNHIYFLKIVETYVEKRLAYDPQKGTIFFMEDFDHRTLAILDKFKFETSKQYVSDYPKKYLKQELREEPFSIEEMREHYSQRLKEGWKKAGETAYSDFEPKPLKRAPMKKDYEHGFTDT